jgi:DNA polymerase sigma
MSRLGPKMAELLFTWGELYPQIKPLVTVIKHWAKVQGLTRPEPGPRVSNFMLIMMAVCYLQSLEVVPSFQHMQELAGTDKLYHKMLHRVHLAMNWGSIGTDCTGSCKSNYHKITNQIVKYRTCSKEGI